jgi:Mn-dependent DtxR family transcriptional regulator
VKVAHAPSATRVAHILMQFNDKEPIVMPNKRLAELLGISERSVRRAVGALADAGAIEVVQDKEMDRTAGFRRIVPDREKLAQITLGKVISAATI